MTDADADTIRLLDDVEAAAYTDLFASAPAELATRLGLRVAPIGGAVVLCAPGLPTPLFNRAIGLGGRAPASADDVDAVLGELRGAPFYVHLSPHARPAALAAWLAARGLVPAPRPAWAKVLRGPEAPPTVDTPLAVRELGPEDADRFGEVAAAAFEMPPPLRAWLAAIVGRPRWRVFGAFDDGDVLCAGGAVFLDGEQAWLGVGGTLPAHRRKHAQRALMARRIAAAVESGCTILCTETGEPRGQERNPSLDNMFACGFRRVASRLNFAPPV